MPEIMLPCAMFWWRLASRLVTYRTHWVLNPGPPHAKQVWVHWAAAPWLLEAMWHVPCIGGRCVHQTKNGAGEASAVRGAARDMWTMDTLGFEPRAFRMRSGCDTTTPCAPYGWQGNACRSNKRTLCSTFWRLSCVWLLKRTCQHEGDANALLEPR